MTKNYSWVTWGILLVLLGCKGGPGIGSGQKIHRQGVSIASNGEKFQLLRDGQPFTIKGGSGSGFLQPLAAAGGNCIRVYDTLDLQQVLDSAYHYDIAVIVDLPMPKSIHNDVFYRHPDKVDALFNGHRRVVKKYKDHPALLMWILGNELDFPYRPKYAPFYQAFNRILFMIKDVDGRHPVATALTNFQKRTITNIRFKLPNLDLLAINTFGKLGTLEQELTAFSWVWEGPYIISEWGINGYWEEENNLWAAPLENSSWKKAEIVKERYLREMPVNDPRFLGSLIFYWGQKHERTPTWFSLFTDEGNPTEMYGAIAEVWQSKSPVMEAPPVNYLEIKVPDENESYILTPNSEQQAEIQFRSAPKYDMRVKWAILPEDWFSLYLDTVPMVAEQTGLFECTTPSSLQFITPNKEGPYRLYAYLSYPHGLVATVNQPFYVVHQ